MYDTKLGISVGQNWGENFHKSKILKFKPIMYGGKQKVIQNVLKATCSFQLQICLNTYAFLLPPVIKGLTPTIS